MAKKIFVGRRRETVRYWNIMFQKGDQIILSQAASYGPLNLDELRLQLKLQPSAVVLVEPVSSTAHEPRGFIDAALRTEGGKAFASV